MDQPSTDSAAGAGVAIMLDTAAIADGTPTIRRNAAAKTIAGRRSAFVLEVNIAVSLPYEGFQSGSGGVLEHSARAALDRWNAQERKKHSGVMGCVKRYCVLFIRSMQMTSLQCRIARAALGWSIDTLSEKAGLRAATVSSFERGGGCYASTIAKLQSALEDGGVMFVGPGEASIAGGAGVRLKA
jgi:hypothetical protein